MNYEVINQKKKLLGLTNAQIAERTGITLSTLDKITSGVNRNPKLDTLQAIASVIGCTLDDFSDDVREDQKSLSLEAQRMGRDFDNFSEEKKRLARGFWALLKQSDSVMDRLDAADEEDESVTG